MKKLLVLFLVLSTMTIGCRTVVEVHETNEHYKVDPNVRPVDNPSQPSTVPSNSNPSNSNPSNPAPSNPAPSNPTNAPAWTQEVIQEQGQSAYDLVRFPNRAQAKLMAKRGAEVDAKRNIIERVLGLRLDSSTTVRDMVTESDQINTQSSGFIRNCYMIGENADDANGIYTVTVALKLYDVYMYMRESKIYYKD